MRQTERHDLMEPVRLPIAHHEDAWDAVSGYDSDYEILHSFPVHVDKLTIKLYLRDRPQHD